MLALVFFVVARDTLLMVTFLVITCMIGLDRLVPYQGSMRLVGAYFRIVHQFHDLFSTLT